MRRAGRIGGKLRAGRTGADALHGVGVAAQDGEEVPRSHVLAAVVLADALVNVLPRRLAQHAAGHECVWSCAEIATGSQWTMAGLGMIVVAHDAQMIGMR